MKSELEKEAILNSYKIFLKTCNFDLQILVQSNKEDLSKHISKIKESIDEYNIESISTIHYTIEDIEERCNILEHVASIMRRRLASVSDEFKTVNYGVFYYI